VSAPQSASAQLNGASLHILGLYSHPGDQRPGLWRHEVDPLDFPRFRHNPACLKSPFQCAYFWATQFLRQYMFAIIACCLNYFVTHLALSLFTPEKTIALFNSTYSFVASMLIFRDIQF
jgi:hypothetical protein